MRRQVLCLVTLRVPFARRHEQVAVAREHEPRAEMLLARDLRLLAEDDLEVGKPAAVQARARDRSPVRIALARLRV